MSDASRRHQVLPLPDGRSLAYAEWGDPEGFPVLSLHGTPGGRLNRNPDESRYSAAGARVITYDRPGYGSSTRHPGRRVVDCVADVAALTDHLGIDRFAVTGGSGGGPHALAVAARLGERVVRARCDVGVGPYDADDLDFFEGMDPLNVEEFGWAVAGEDVLAGELTRELKLTVDRVADDPSKMLGEEWSLPESDRAVMARDDTAVVIREFVADLDRGGVWGWVDDDLAFVTAWGFDPAGISVPVRVRYGRDDVLVPAAHGAWLGRHIPGADVVIVEGRGHMGDPERAVADTRWLVTGEDAG